MVRDEITEMLKKALKDLPELPYDLIEPLVDIERPKDSSNGDYSTSVALVAFAKIKNPARLASESVTGRQKSRPPRKRERYGQAKIKNPLELAEKIVSVLNSKILNLNSGFDKIEAVKPGFINFYLSNDYLQDQVQSIIEKGNSYGSPLQKSLPVGSRASVEFVSANPTGPLHIGNAVGGPIGDVLANVLEKSGYKVTREYLHNDVGGQIDRLGEAIYFELNPGEKSENYVVQYRGTYIKELAKEVEEELYEDEDLSQNEFIEKAGKIAVRIMLEEILKDCEDMGIKYDVVRKESDLRQEVSKVLPKIKKYLKENEGALWFAPNDEFLKDRETVVKKSDGQYTYFASDIVYHNEKMGRNDLVVDVLGSNHSGHVPRLKAVVKALGYNPDDLKVILYQYVRLKKGNEIVKMGKRTGNFVTAREVLDEVGKDAFRFFLLRSAPETHMDFDLELAKKQASENPVFYVQYAYSRICSIFAKIKNLSGNDTSLLTQPEEIAVIRHLLKFPELIEEVSHTFGVHVFTTYALELATLFHKFYEAHRVISDDKKQTQARLALLEAIRITLKNTLDILGISAPEHM